MCLALLSEYDGRGRPVSVSLSRDHYSKIPKRHRPVLYQYRPVREAVEHLAGEGLILFTKGSPQTRGWQSFMSATPAFANGVREEVAKGGLPKLIRPARSVVVRDAQGQIIDKPLTREQARMQRNLDEMNEAIESVEIPNGQGGSLVRIFNQSMGRGGRAYVMGGGYQSLKKEARLRLSIDGEAVIEVDFKALHPSLLYARAGVPMPSNPYDLPQWPRDIVKRGLLIVINARTLRDAVEALAHSAPMQDFIIPQRFEDPMGAARDAARRVLAELKRLHAPIAGAFHSDAGAGLMRIDSDMVETVVLDLLSRGIVALPIHDSFLVPASKEQDLIAAMVRAAQMQGLSDPKWETFRL